MPWLATSLKICKLIQFLSETTKLGIFNFFYCLAINDKLYS